MNPNLNKQAQADNKQFKQSYIRAQTHIQNIYAK